MDRGAEQPSNEHQRQKLIRDGAVHDTQGEVTRKPGFQKGHTKVGTNRIKYIDDQFRPVIGRSLCPSANRLPHMFGIIRTRINEVWSCVSTLSLDQLGPAGDVVW